ncbi:hypothetical protein C8A03DRAFT_30175 [Achaetomium macrosporum]|uniref:Uncharacterized protein n=1 Tax=Achaetomium macrosporum TaxID=79813 RepID=A0AAN7HFU1_9PEZI|nr:hypothetical protein C8A03DRAFT_30175 [Achaetomium macrosporum]
MDDELERTRNALLSYLEEIRARRALEDLALIISNRAPSSRQAVQTTPPPLSNEHRSAPTAATIRNTSGNDSNDGREMNHGPAPSRSFDLDPRLGPYFDPASGRWRSDEEDDWEDEDDEHDDRDRDGEDEEGEGKEQEEVEDGDWDDEDDEDNKDDGDDGDDADDEDDEGDEDDEDEEDQETEDTGMDRDSPPDAVLHRALRNEEWRARMVATLGYCPGLVARVARMALKCSFRMLQVIIVWVFRKRE